MRAAKGERRPGARRTQSKSGEIGVTLTELQRKERPKNENGPEFSTPLYLLTSRGSRGKQGREKKKKKLVLTGAFFPGRHLQPLRWGHQRQQKIAEKTCMHTLSSTFSTFPPPLETRKGFQ